MTETQTVISPEDMQRRVAQLEAYLHPDERELAKRAAHYAGDDKGHIAAIAQKISGIFPPRTMDSFFKAGFVRALQTFPYINPQEAIPVLINEANTSSFQKDIAKKPFRDAYLFAAEILQ